MEKPNNRQKLGEDKWSHLYTVYHPHTAANRLYGFHLKYGQKSHNRSARRLGKGVLNGITQARQKTRAWGCDKVTCFMTVF